LRPPSGTGSNVAAKTPKPVQLRIELGREERLPNTALRRKLEAEQPGGCAWLGCGRPVSWTEAHHIVHWPKVTNLRPAFPLLMGYHVQQLSLFSDP
jgi:hypothetical protein